VHFIISEEHIRPPPLMEAAEAAVWALREAAEAAVWALRESETRRHECEATLRDLEAARGECAAAVGDRQVAVGERDQALRERDELMRNTKTKDAEIERLRKLAYGREVFDVDAGGIEVVEGRDEEPAAKRVRREQVKLLNRQCFM
jgi:hypothetical protein